MTLTISGPTFLAVTLALSLAVVLLVATAQAQYVPPVGPPVCVRNCGSPPPPTSYPPPTYPPGGTRQPEMTEQERAEAVDEANENGSEAFNRGDWLLAIKYFEEALQYDPHNPNLLHNLRRAREQQQTATYRPWQQPPKSQEEAQAEIGRAHV